MNIERLENMFKKFIIEENARADIEDILMVGGIVISLALIFFIYSDALAAKNSR